MAGGANAKTGSAGATQRDGRARTLRSSAAIAQGGSTASCERLREGGADAGPKDRRRSTGEAVGVGYALTLANGGSTLAIDGDHSIVGETEPAGCGDGGVGGRYGAVKWSRNRAYSAAGTVRRKSSARR